MDTKESILRTLRAEFDNWVDLLDNLSEQQCLTPLQPSSLSVKDNIAHLQTWQSISIARGEAALFYKDPHLPQWPAGLDPDCDEDLDQINAWIYITNQNINWPDVYHSWKEGFLRFLQIGESIAEADMLAAGRFLWLENYPLAVVFTASCEHHAEHREMIQAWFNTHTG
jgi:hypothetical protein